MLDLSVHVKQTRFATIKFNRDIAPAIAAKSNADIIITILLLARTPGREQWSANVRSVERRIFCLHDEEEKNKNKNSLLTVLCIYVYNLKLI